MGKQFTEEQHQLLRKNPYVYAITGSRIQLTKEFKEIFLTAYNEGQSPRQILEDHGFDINIIGEHRIWSISQHIRDEYKKYGEFHEGYTQRRSGFNTVTASNQNQPLSDKEAIKQLEHKVDYLTQEMEFLKKISSIRTTRK